MLADSILGPDTQSPEFPGLALVDTTSDNRIDHVAEYILSNLDTGIDLEILSQQAGMSKFHFVRRFQEHTGHSPARFVRRARLKRASLQLIYDRSRRITDIAMDAGFDFPESFARVFRQQYGQSPTQFRRRPDWESWWHVHQKAPKKTVLSSQEKHAMNVHIINFPETRIAALEHHGPESRTYESTMKFIEWRRANGVKPGDGETYGIHYSDPRVTFPEDYRLDICVSVEHEIAENPQGVVNKVIPACRCAVARHKGSREHVSAAEYLVFEWLPGSGEELGEFPVFFHYLNVGPNVRDIDMITDVYLPLR